MNNVYSQMGLSSTSVNLKNLNGAIFITAEGYCAVQLMNITMDVTVSGETVAADVNMTVSYINPGQPVDFTLPSTDGYTDASQAQ